MNSINANKQSTSAGNAGDASPLGSTPPSAAQASDKENLLDLHANPPNLQTFRTSNQHSLLANMTTYTNQLPFNAWNESASGSKGPVPTKRRRPDGAVSKLPSGTSASVDERKAPRKRTSSMAELDDSPLPSKRSRNEVPFNFIKDLEQLDENLETSHRILLDIIDAQDKRELYLHAPEDIPIIVPSIDPRDLFGSSSASSAGADGSRLEEISGERGMRDRSVLSLLRDYSGFGCFVGGLWSGEDKQEPQTVADRSSQEGGDYATTFESDLLYEDNRVDADEAPTNYETNGPLLSPAPLPIIEGGGLSEADVNTDSTFIPSSSTLDPRTVSIPPYRARAPLETVPEAFQSPKATTNPTGERESGTHSNGIVGTGAAGPSNPTYTSFAYTQAQAQEIWELTCDKNYLGAHALFDEREQVIVVGGQEKVRRYLNAYPDMRERLKDTNNGRPRDSLYICGASAIWRKVEKSQNSTAGETPGFELTYKPCHGCAYATMDNYKKHIYRHHLGKVYKQYSWKEKRRA